MEIDIDRLGVYISSPFLHDDEKDPIRQTIERQGKILKIVELVTGEYAIIVEKWDPKRRDSSSRTISCLYDNKEE